jgi:hypothetical protein
MLDVFLGQVPLNAMGNTSSKQVFNVKTAVRPIIQIEFEAVILILSLLGRITDDNPDLNVYGDTRKDGTNNPCCGPETGHSYLEVIPSSCDGNQGTSTRPKGINFNEWARGLPVLVSADNANRVVSNIGML